MYEFKLFSSIPVTKSQYLLISYIHMMYISGEAAGNCCRYFGGYEELEKSRSYPNIRLHINSVYYYFLYKYTILLTYYISNINCLTKIWTRGA